MCSTLIKPCHPSLHKCPPSQREHSYFISYSVHCLLYLNYKLTPVLNINHYEQQLLLWLSIRSEQATFRADAVTTPRQEHCTPEESEVVLNVISTLHASSLKNPFCLHPPEDIPAEYRECYPHAVPAGSAARGTSIHKMLLFIL